MKTLTTLLLLFLFAGCYQPGGGGVVHKPPDGIERNLPTDLIVTFSVWGAGSGRLDRRYTDVICIYRINDSETRRLSGTVESASESNMEMKFTIPPLDLKEGDTVTYSFDVLFDKNRSVRNGGTLDVKK